MRRLRSCDVREGFRGADRLESSRIDSSERLIRALTWSVQPCVPIRCVGRASHRRTRILEVTASPRNAGRHRELVSSGISCRASCQRVIVGEPRGTAS